MSIEVITSRSNPRIKQVAMLMQKRQERQAQRLFVLEGLRLCQDAAHSGVAIRELYFTEAARRKYPGLEEIARKASASYCISASVGERLSDTRSSQGVFALCSMLDNSEAAVTIGNDSENGKYVLLSSLQDPGNLGTIIRTAEALGIDGLFMSSDCPDLYSPKVVRGAMGGILRLPIAICGDIPATVRRLRQGGIAVYAAALSAASASLEQLAPGRTAVVIGNEGNGLPPELITQCDASVAIPMAGGAESLNAGTAAAILMWEMTKRKLEVRN